MQDAPTVTFDSDAQWRDELLAVTLFAAAGRQRFKCLVRGEALDEAFGCAPEPAARLAAFCDNRERVEAALRQSIAGRHWERDPQEEAAWQVVLLPSDLT